MTATVDPRSTDDAELNEFGYKQELARSLGSFATFAAGISYISILTGTFQLFYFGFAFGGPAYWWSWPMVFAGQLMVALCFAELASRYPIAGSIYNWSKRLGSQHVAWLAGWIMLTTSVAAVLLVILLAANITRGPGVVTETQGLGDSWELGYLGAFLAASLASAYVMYGFDTASSPGEESLNPRKNAPRAILRALIASFIIGGLILLLAMMAVTDITAAGISTGGPQVIVLDVLGGTVGDLFLWSVVIAITVCNLAVHTAAIRMMFAMARDNNLPAGERLATINPKTKTPIVPAVVIGLL